MENYKLQCQPVLLACVANIICENIHLKLQLPFRYILGKISLQMQWRLTLGRCFHVSCCSIVKIVPCLLNESFVPGLTSFQLPLCIHDIRGNTFKFPQCVPVLSQGVIKCSKALSGIHWLLPRFHHGYGLIAQSSMPERTQKKYGLCYNTRVHDNNSYTYTVVLHLSIVNCKTWNVARMEWIVDCVYVTQ